MRLVHFGSPEGSTYDEPETESDSASKEDS